MSDSPSTCLVDGIIEYKEAVEAVKKAFGDDASLPPLRERDVAPIASSAIAKKVKQEGGDQVMEDRTNITTLIPFLTPEHIAMPKLPTKEEMDKVLLGLRKQALLQEYIGA
jgi:pre-mRNA-splicing factor ISY1